MADSSGFSIAKFIGWQHAKCGNLKVSDFAKLHLIHTGKTCTATVTPGKRNDSPYLRPMTGILPAGSGHVIADAICGGKNCIRGSGRTPIIYPKAAK